MSHKQKLLDRLTNRSATLGIIGLGYVGLPLAVEFAETGFNVIGFDLDAKKVNAINSGESYIPDIPTERLKPLVENGKLRATTNDNDLSSVDSVNICVPTPINMIKDPDMSYVISAIDSVAKIAHEGMIILLESTTYPGATEELVQPKLIEAGLVVGESVFVAFSAERIDPGNKVYNVHNTPKVVGGVTNHCADIAVALYSSAVTEVVIVSSPATAEMVKLLENTFRAVNIGLVNEIAIMCDKLDIDAWEVIKAASTKPFGFMPFYPGPGIGGHCIPVDPHYLSWKLKTLNYNARFIELASEINTYMPTYVLGKITDALNDDCKAVKNANIVVLGVAYKRDIDDVRESPALDIIELLHQKGANVTYHDPYIPSIKLKNNEIMETSVYNDELIDNAECVVIVTDHSNYDWEHVLDHASIVVDTRHVTDKNHAGKARVVTL